MSAPLPPETPNPSIAEIRAQRDSHTGRLSIAADEIARRVSALLPGLIADFNEKQGYNAKNGVHGLASIETTPARLSDSFLGPNAAGKAFVSLVCNTVAITRGFTYGNEIQLSFSIIDAPITSANQIRFSYERIELIREALFPFIDGCTDAKHQRCWKILEPTGYRALPQEVTKYSGIVGTWRMLQVPNAGVFPVPQPIQ
jgi:hypothetical protein